MSWVFDFYGLAVQKAREPTDAEVDAVVNQYPDGAPTDVIAAVLGVTRQRAEQIIAEATNAALSLFRRCGLKADDVFP